MRILFLTFYYEPDLSAGSFRSTALVNELKQREGITIDVITTLPNRYSTFEINANEIEKQENVNIWRIALPAHNSGMLDQAKAFYKYYKEALRLTKTKDYDLVYATSSRLFTAFLGARISVKKRLPLYLDIRDIFVDTIKDVLSSKIVFFAKPVLNLIERYTFSKAKHINLVSEGFRDYFEQRYSKCEYSWFTNGIDNEFLDHDFSNTPDKKIKILYAGNIGEGQGLHNIIPELSLALQDQAEFTVVGSGGRLSQLKKHIPVHSPVKRVELLKLYKDCDVLFLHLNDYPAFKKVLPSKIFEYAATGKPILAGVSGFSAKFLKDEVVNSAVFYPGDVKEAVSAFHSLKISHSERVSFIQKYNRDIITKNMASNILSYANKSPKS